MVVAEWNFLKQKKTQDTNWLPNNNKITLWNNNQIVQN